MHAPFVIMTILGCDHSATDCHYVATIEQRWPTIELCNAASEKKLASFTNVPYPLVVAACQNPVTATGPDVAAEDDPEAHADQVLSPAEEQFLAQRAMERAGTTLPDTDWLRFVVEKPLNLIEGGYSWVVRKLR